MGGALENCGASPRVRRGLWIGVCIPLRLAYAGIVGWLASTQESLYLFVFVGIEALLVVSFFTRGLCKPYEVWWPRMAHAFMAALAIAMAAGTVKKRVPGWSVGLVLAADVLIGVVWALVRRPYRDNTPRYQAMPLTEVV